MINCIPFTKSYPVGKANRGICLGEVFWMGIETERLILRPWQAADLVPFIRMNKDPDVMRFFTGPLEAEQTKEFYESILREFAEYGYGLYAAEEKGSGCFIGFRWAKFEAAFCPCEEIGWRLCKEYWGKGYATEGAKACLSYGFEKLAFDKIYSFTSIENKASQRVMQKIGMRPERYFDHPNVPLGHPLRPHICYCIKNG